MAPSLRRITGIHACLRRGAFLSALGSRENELLPRSRTCFESVAHPETGSVAARERMKRFLRPVHRSFPCGSDSSELRSCGFRMSTEPYELRQIHCQGTPERMGHAQGEQLRDDIQRFVEQRFEALEVYMTERNQLDIAGFLEAGANCLRITAGWDEAGTR